MWHALRGASGFSGLTVGHRRAVTPRLLYFTPARGEWGCERGAGQRPAIQPTRQSALRWGARCFVENGFRFACWFGFLETCNHPLFSIVSRLEHKRRSMRAKTATLIATVTATALSTFAAVDTSKLPPPSTKTGLTFAKDIKPIFDTSCTRCHGEQRQKAKLRLDTLEGTLKGSEDGPVLVAGKSDQSSLVHAVARLDEEKAMPPMRKGGRGPGNRSGGSGGGPGGQNPQNGGQRQNRGPGGGPQAKSLTAEQVGLIRAWIDQGAK
jgi:hypothetical protein